MIHWAARQHPLPRQQRGNGIVGADCASGAATATAAKFELYNGTRGTLVKLGGSRRALQDIGVGYCAIPRLGLAIASEKQLLCGATSMCGGCCGQRDSGYDGHNERKELDHCEFVGGYC